MFIHDFEDIQSLIVDTTNNIDIIKILGSNRAEISCRKLHNEELHNLYSSRNTIRTIE
jgi:hypothetical protein